MKRLIMTYLLLIIGAISITAATEAEYQEALKAAKSKYTKEKPLVIMTDWEFSPYTFLNDNGQPSGVAVEMAKEILNKAGIAYEFQMHSWPEVLKAIDNNKADMLLDMKESFGDLEGIYIADSALCTYPIAIVQRADDKTLVSIKDLNNTVKLAGKKGDYAYIYLIKHGVPEDSISATMPYEGISGVEYGKYDAYIWGEITLKNLMAHFDYPHLKLSHFDIPAPEIKILCFDKDVNTVCNHLYQQMQENGKFDKIRNKWFSEKDDSLLAISLPSLISIILAFVAICILVWIFTSRERMKEATRKGREINQLARTANSDVVATVFDIKKNLITNELNNLLPQDGIPGEDTAKYIDETSQRTYIQEIPAMISGEKDFSRVSVRWNLTGDPDKPDWRNFRIFSAVEKDESGQPSKIFNVIFDVTEEVENINEMERLTNIYHKIFDHSVVAQAFFTPDGEMRECNEKMKSLEDLLKLRHDNGTTRNLFDLEPLCYIINRGHKEVLSLGHYFPDGPDHKRCMEIRYYPALNDEGEILFINLALFERTEERDITVESLKLKRMNIEENKKIDHYMDDFMQVLKDGNMTVWQLDEDGTRYIVNKDIREEGIGLTLEEFGQLCMPDSKEEWNRLMKIFKSDSTEPVKALLHVSRNVFVNSDVWMAISGIPVLDENGKKINYFGLSKNVTEIKKLEARLKEETDTANNSANLKSTFMANMSHEIRTPLNSILGFSELLTAADDDEKKVFSNIIRSNCDMLMRLINDILDLSEMDSNGLTMRPKDIDFAKEFNEMCNSLKERVKDEKVQFIIDNPYDTLNAHLDIDRIRQVLTNFVTNAIKYTKEGHIKAGYRKEDDNTLYIYCEDTGSGIPKEKSEKVFERFVKLNDFVQGTGIGLSICRAIADACGGKIGVDSEVGKGSTFWVRIPING